MLRAISLALGLSAAALQGTGCAAGAAGGPAPDAPASPRAAPGSPAPDAPAPPRAAPGSPEAGASEGPGAASRVEPSAPAPPAPPSLGDLPLSLYHESRAAADAGDTERQLTLLGQAVRTDPAWLLPRVELAELLLSAGRDLDVARQLVADGVAQGGDTPRLHRLHAALLELAGDDAAAADAYGRFLAQRDDPDLRLRRALVLERAGRLPEAIEEAERVVRERPDQAAPRRTLAELYEAAGRVKDAESQLLELAGAARGEPQPLRELARFYRRQGREDQARAAEERARKAAAPRRQLRPLPPSRR